MDLKSITPYIVNYTPVEPEEEKTEAVPTKKVSKWKVVQHSNHFINITMCGAKKARENSIEEQEVSKRY